MQDEKDYIAIQDKSDNYSIEQTVTQYIFRTINS